MVVGLTCDGTMVPAPAPSETSWSRSRNATCARVVRGTRASATRHTTRAPPILRTEHCALRTLSRTDARSGIVRRQNGLEALAGPGAADRSPLTHPDAMAVA